MADTRDPGASGTLEARFISLEKAVSKNGKAWGKVKLDVAGVEVQARAYGDTVLGKLEGFAKREVVTFWGTLESSKTDQGNVFTNLKIAKVYDDGDDRDGGKQCYVLGTITEIGDVIGKDGKNYGKYMDMDVTANTDYPTFVRLQFAFGTGPGDLAVGECIEIDTYLSKFGIWVVDGPEKTGGTRAIPEGTRSFRREEPKGEAAQAPTPRKSAAAAPSETPKPTTGGTDDDIPW
jgi:hypothetical protein